MIVRRPEMRDRLAEVLAMLTNKPSFTEAPIIVAENVEVDIDITDETDGFEVDVQEKEPAKHKKDDE